ncbi:hypothetical protein MN210_18980 [Psychrobacter raelei]|uniref:Uncharacterized protein n=1 Tax=Psychrobacter raelei TaxID=2565531 RepID=A0AAU6PU32_9GAMM
MKDEFKAGDLVFEVDEYYSEIKLASVIRVDPDAGDSLAIETKNNSYASYGRNSVESKLPSVFYATPENRQALVTLYGEDAVPELPLRGSELTRKLLEKQKYVLCLVSNINEDKARRNDPPKVGVVSGVISDWFRLADESVAEFAVPVDNNGNEITEIESC